MSVNVYYENHELEPVSLLSMENYQLYEVDDPKEDWHGSIVCTCSMMRAVGQVFVIYGKSCQSLHTTYANGVDRKVFRPIKAEVTIRRK